MHAVDQDVGLNGTVLYSLVHRDQANPLPVYLQNRGKLHIKN